MDNTTQLDHSVVALMHGLKTAEGTNGNYNITGDRSTAAGVGQWSNQINGKVQPLQKGQVPYNFQNQAKTFGLDPADFSPENQNKVMYAVLSQDKKDGLTPEQSLSKWNSGDPNKYANPATSTGTGQVGAYDVGAYVQKGMSAAQQYAQQNGLVKGSQVSPLQQTPDSTPEAPSVGGFLKNTVQSGANFLGNTADALLHPINTIQNIGGTAVGGLQELGGQTNDNTAKFDNLKNYFVQKYGGIDKIEHSLYTDPIGVAADVSAALGIGGGLAGVVGKGAELSGIGAYDIAGATGEAGKFGGGFSSDIGAVQGNSVAEVANTAKNVLNTGSHITNPLTLPLKGVGAVLNGGGGALKNVGSQFTEISPKGMQDIIDHPQDYSPSAIANTSRITVAKQVEEALQSKIAEKAETGAGYTPYKETPNAIKVAPDFLDNVLRSAAKVDVTDGVIKPSSTSAIRTSAELSKLQGVYNLYKPDFLKGTMTSEKFLNLRTDLADIAYNDSGIKNTKLASVGENIRNSLNKEYRSQIPGLEEKDLDFSTQTEELKNLRKGFIDKEGNLTDAAISKIANAGNKYDALQRLEQIVPGITRKLEILKTIDEIEKASGIKVGAYTKSIAEGGGVIAGLSTGNLPMVAGALTLSILTSPKVAVPLLRLYGFNKPLVSRVMSNLAKAATIGASSNQISSQTATQDQQMPRDTMQTGTTVNPSMDSNSNVVSSSQQDITQTPGYQEAIKAGYAPQEIQEYLAKQ